jgi:3-deoxy-D-manno-octulosonic-acid transferase
MYFLYKFLTYIFYPFSNLYLIIRKIKKKEHSVRYKEKLSKINIKREEGFLVWFHAASVGEGLSILPIIENLTKEEKIKKILITTITLSSAEVLNKKLKENNKIIHQFLPLDVTIYVKKFLDHWKPNLAIFVDSEIWPNLILQIKEKKIPLSLINGRITKKTFFRWKFFSSFAKKIFKSFDLCVAANSESEKYLKILGVNKVNNYGNIKFSIKTSTYSDASTSFFLEKIKNRKVWCAASTHEPEEVFCAKTHLKIKNNYKNVLTIIIPRHVNRINSISKKLSKLNIKFCYYSKLDKINDDTDILLIDVYGETLKFFNISWCVFLGGSLIEHGGQNPIESSKVGCKIYHGPNVDNFTEIYQYLNSLSISTQIETIDELSQCINREFKTPKSNNNEIIKKINNHGNDILNKVIKDLKKYI